jgi:hypothetical protein
MANRIAAPILFEGLSPPWVLSQLDANFTGAQGALNDSSLGFSNFAGTDSGVANIYAVTLPIGVPSSYNPGMMVAFNPANTNNGPSTISVSPLGSVAILYPSGAPLVGGEIVAGTTAFMVYNGTAFLMINPLIPSSLIPNSGLLYANQNFGTVVTNQALDCVGAVGVNVTLSTGTTGLNLTLQHLAIAVPVLIWLKNASGGTINIGVQATNPANASLTVIGTGNAGSQNTLSSGVSFTAGIQHTFFGSSNGATLLGVWN